MDPMLFALQMANIQNGEFFAKFRESHMNAATFGQDINEASKGRYGVAAGNQASPSSVPPSQHETAMQGVEDHIHTLGMRLEELVHRIDPVSSPRSTQASDIASKVTSKTSGSQIPSVQKLNRLQTILESHIATAEDAIKRLGI